MTDTGEMSLFEASRWEALTEAVNIIADECEERKINFNRVKLEPIVLRKYVENTCDTIYQKIAKDRERKQTRKMALTQDLTKCLVENEVIQ